MSYDKFIRDIVKSNMSNCFDLIVYNVRIRRDTFENHVKQIARYPRLEVESIWEGKGTLSKQGELSRKFMNNIIRGFCSELP